MYIKMLIVALALMAASSKALADGHVSVTEVYLAYPEVPTIKVQVAMPLAQILPTGTVTGNYVQAREFYFAEPLAVYAVEMPIAAVAATAKIVNYCDVAPCYQQRTIRRIRR